MPHPNLLRQAAYAPDSGPNVFHLPWADRAACSGHDPELWFCDSISADTASALRRREQVAKTICGGCPVAAECLADALARDDRYGIWGGYSAAERRILARGGRVGA